MTGSADRWRILSTGTDSAYYNMALDEVLAKNCAAGDAPVFRVYDWASPAITIGYAQRTDGMIDFDACDRAEVEVTRRLTGGRALFHVNELAYTVIAGKNDPVFGGTITETYRRINRVIARAFDRCGITGVTEHEPTAERIPASLRRGAPCFATPTRYELAYDGMKVSGGAQRRFHGIFCQQGSVRLGPGAERIAGFLIDRDAAEIYRDALSDGNDRWDMPSAKLFRDAFIAAFTEAVDTTIMVGTVTDAEHRTAQALATSRYRAKGWIHGGGSVDL